MSQETTNVSFFEDVKADINKIYIGPGGQLDDLCSIAKQDLQEDGNPSEYQMKLMFNLIKEISLQIKSGQLNHRNFLLDAMKESKLWQPLMKIILSKRIEELKQCKVVKKGKNYDIAGLKETFLGNFIAERLGFARRHILNTGEYQNLVTQIKKLNYDIPITIEPTKTEKYFE